MKDAYFFSHDSNAQQDPKIIRLVMEMKMEGYGIFWSIIEHLRNDDDYKLNISDSNAIAFQSHCEQEKVLRVINGFDLFIIEKNGDFYSSSLMQRMEALSLKREKARASANYRWSNNAKAMRTHSEGNASKVKEVKKSKVNTPINFIEELKNTYPTINLEVELTKMRGWLLSRPNRKLTKKFAINWLNTALENGASLETKQKHEPRPFPQDA